MVVGPVMDVLKAQREGKDVLHVIMEGNRLLSTHLSTTAKLMFWLTNVPYYVLAAKIGSSAPSSIVPAGSPSMHAAAVLGIAIVSTAYHGIQVFDPQNPWSPRLLTADICAANGYGILLAILTSFWRKAEGTGINQK